MRLRFTKMNGAGNDFIVINDDRFTPEPKLIQWLCDRHFGIGADGVLLIKKSASVDFVVQYFNSDGSGDALCVNGARCAVLFAYQNYFYNQKCRFEFIGKIFEAEVLDKNQVKVFLDYSPIFELNKNISFRSKIISLAYFDLGSKHVVINWDVFFPSFHENQILKSFEDFDINSVGKELRFHLEFQPSGVNVNFIKKIKDNFYKIRTYERGVEAETLACGSGSIASAMYVHLNENISPPIELLTKSNKVLKVDFKFSNNFFKDISLIGPAEKVFEGLIDV